MHEYVCVCVSSMCGLIIVPCLTTLTVSSNCFTNFCISAAFCLKSALLVSTRPKCDEVERNVCDSDAVHTIQNVDHFICMVGSSRYLCSLECCLRSRLAWRRNLDLSCISSTQRGCLSGRGNECKIFIGGENKYLNAGARAINIIAIGNDYKSRKGCLDDTRSGVVVITTTPALWVFCRLQTTQMKGGANEQVRPCVRLFVHHHHVHFPHVSNQHLPTFAAFCTRITSSTPIFSPRCKPKR